MSTTIVTTNNRRANARARATRRLIERHDAEFREFLHAELHEASLAHMHSPGVHHTVLARFDAQAQA